MTNMQLQLYYLFYLYWKLLNLSEYRDKLIKPEF